MTDMYTMAYDIEIGSYRLGMLDSVEVVSSVGLLADTAKIVLPGAEYNQALDVESRLKRGDEVVINLYYREEGAVTEFEGWLQRIATDDGNITLYCEDDLFLTRKAIGNAVMKNIKLADLLRHVVSNLGLVHDVRCSYDWTYSKFVINNATGYDVLRKVQAECGADIYIRDGVLHVHPPGETVGVRRRYDFARNIEQSSLTYRSQSDKKYLVVVKANMPDGTVKELEIGTTGGDKITVNAATCDENSMRLRGELELKRHLFDGYEGSITGWLIPVCRAGDSVTLHDRDYPRKDGTYFVESVKTTFSKEGGKREITLGYRLS